MNETLEASEKIAQVYQPNNTIEYIAVMCVIAYALFLISRYFMIKKQKQPESDIKRDIKELKNDIKEEFNEIKDILKDITNQNIDSGKKLARDYTRLNESDKKFETLFDHMNSSNKELAEMKGRLA